MKIIKYEKKGNGKYRVYLENNLKIDLYEEVIIKNNLLYKKEIDHSILMNIDEDNQKYDIYNRCLKYIGTRLRSQYEMKEYIRRYTDNDEIAQEIMKKLLDNQFLNDEAFAKAFINDKFKFTTMGPYMISKELKRHNISDEIIYKYLDQISKQAIAEKMEKQIMKIIKSSKNRDKSKHKIYDNLMRLGYKSEDILKHINNNL